MDELDRWYSSHYARPGDRLIRLERQPIYADNAAMLARWNAGETEPDWHSPWCLQLSANQADGMVEERIRVFSADLTDDEEAAIVLGYPATSRYYRRMSVFREGEHAVPGDLGAEDFYVAARADSVSVAVLRYGPAIDGGPYLGVTVLDDPARCAPYLAAADHALAAGESFAHWYARHVAELVPRKVA